MSLKSEAADALYAKIKELAEETGSASYVRDLAEAYSLVSSVTAGGGSPRKAVTG